MVASSVPAPLIASSMVATAAATGSPDSSAAARSACDLDTSPAMSASMSRPG
jgi:hypothetical protein